MYSRNLYQTSPQYVVQEEIHFEGVCASFTLTVEGNVGYIFIFEIIVLVVRLLLDCELKYEFAKLWGDFLLGIHL